MTTLLILGNTNLETFANSIIAANCKSEEIFQRPISKIFVLHSNESYKKAISEQSWLEHVKLETKSSNEEIQIGEKNFIIRVFDFSSTESTVKELAEYIEFILQGSSEDSTLMIDLFNGTSNQKNILSIICYILDIKHQYVIDLGKLCELTNQIKGYLPARILSPCYISVPDNTMFDQIAYLDLSEFKRYKRKIESLAEKYHAIDEDLSDKTFFEKNLYHSMVLKFQGDRSNDNTLYRIAVSSLSASVEDLIRVLINHCGIVESPDHEARKTLGEKINFIREAVERQSENELDLEFFRKFNEFILYLRNSTTHKGRALTSLERFKAELSTGMLFPFMDFYIDIVFPLIKNLSSTRKAEKLRDFIPCASDNEIIYYGLDGDNTGAILEHLFLSSRNEQVFKKLSKSVTKAIGEIAKKIEGKSGTIVFKAGDDLLFKGIFSREELLEMQKVYSDLTNDVPGYSSGLTCSIGYGRSLKEVYLALKVAKANPGKNSIFGLELC